MRPYRDTRFAKEKTPHKTNVGIQFRYEHGKDVHAPGFCLHIDSPEVFIGASMWRPKSKPLRDVSRAFKAASPLMAFLCAAVGARF